VDVDHDSDHDRHNGTGETEKVEYNEDILLMIQANLQRLEALKGEWSDHSARMAPTEPSAVRFRDWAQERYAEVDDVSLPILPCVAWRSCACISD
jgi:hypothetical protein